MLEHDASDHVVRLRRVEANRQLGRYEVAHADIGIIVDACLEARDPVQRKARKLKAEMHAAETKSSNEFRGTLSTVMSSDIFSSDRHSTGKIGTDSSGTDESSAVQRLRYLRLGSSNKPTSTVGSSVPSDDHPASRQQRRSVTPRPSAVAIEIVEEMQREQLALFSSPEVQKSLRQMRLDADLEQVRFLHRFKPFKLHVQKSLLLKFGYDPSQNGLVKFERAIAVHMSSTPSVAAHGKDIMLTIMGDIW